MGRPKGSTSVFKKMEWREQIRAIEMYVRQGLYPAYILDNESIPTRKRMKRDFRKMAESYTVIDGNLRKLKICRKFKDAPSEKDWALVVKKRPQQMRLIKEFHEGAGGGHFGITRVQNKLCGKYYWQNMVEDVRYYIKTCKKCQRMNRSSLLKPKIELRPVPVPSRIFAQIGLDLIHMNKCQGYQYIITAIDYLSKYCEMRALKEKTAKEVATFIYEDLICRWGCSEYHINDQGREFVNATNRELLELCGTKQRITSSYHPQANGLSERINKTTQETLAKSLENENTKDWVEMIPAVAFSHRTSMNASTRIAPLEMILGHKPRVPIDIEMKFPTARDIERDLTEEEVITREREYLNWSIEHMNKLKQVSIGRAKVNIANSQIRQKRNYDKRFENQEKFKVGDVVLLENQVHKNRKGGKRDERYSGPYTILEISQAGNCTLKHVEGCVKKTKHPLAHLKLYHERNLTVDIGHGTDTDDDGAIGKMDGRQEITIHGVVDQSNENGHSCFAENVVGLVIKEKFKNKRKRHMSNVNITGEPVPVQLSESTMPDDDTLPDLDTETVPPAEKVFKGAHFTGVRVTDGPIGTHNEPTIALESSGPDNVDNLFREGEERMNKGLRKLSLCLKKMKQHDDVSIETENGKLEIVDDLMDVESSQSLSTPSSVVLERDVEGEHFIFIPIGMESRRKIARLFGINLQGPTPKYSGIMRTCSGKPTRVYRVEGDGNCLFNSMSYVISSHEKFNWKIRQEVCNYIENQWTLVKSLSGCSEKYKNETAYLEMTKMRENKTWGGSVEKCALAMYTGHDVITYYRGSYYKFGNNFSEECFYFYHPEGHYDVILEP